MLMYCLPFFNFRLLITPLVSSNFSNRPTQICKESKVSQWVWFSQLYSNVFQSGRFIYWCIVLIGWLSSTSRQNLPRKLYYHTTRIIPFLGCLYWLTLLSLQICVGRLEKFDDTNSYLIIRFLIIFSLSDVLLLLWLLTIISIIVNFYNCSCLTLYYNTCDYSWLF
jgi:hypothetical protein